MQSPSVGTVYITLNVDSVNTDGLGGVMSTDSYHHGDLRAALLSVAVEAIAEQGVHRLSLRDCARRVGVSHSAPYRHFPTKAALLTAICGEGFRLLVAAGEAAMAEHTALSEKLDAYGVAYVTFSVAHPVHYRVMFSESLDLSLVTPEEQKAGDRAFELLSECAAALPGGEEDPEAAAFAFWSLVHGIAMLVLDGRIPPERLERPGGVEALTRAAYRTWRLQG